MTLLTREEVLAVLGASARDLSIHSPEADDAKHDELRTVIATITALYRQRDELVEALRGCIEHMEWSTEHGEAAYQHARSAIAQEQKT